MRRLRVLLRRLSALSAPWRRFAGWSPIAAADSASKAPSPEQADSLRPARAFIAVAVLISLAAGLPILAAVAATEGRSSNSAASPPDGRVRLASPRIVVLKGKRVLHLFDGESLVRTYPLDLGTNPIGQKLRSGDNRTPLGSFRVISKNSNSPYYRFLGINYPDRAAVEAGLTRGLISTGEASAILNAHDAGRCPDWSTALGGGIGIHGRRLGRDWTAGCVALADEHVEELFAVMRIGDPVEILP